MDDQKLESDLRVLVYTAADMCKLAIELEIERRTESDSVKEVALLSKGEGLREGFLILKRHIKKAGLDELFEITAKDINKKLSK